MLRITIRTCTFWRGLRAKKAWSLRILWVNCFKHSLVKFLSINNGLISTITRRDVVMLNTKTVARRIMIFIFCLFVSKYIFSIFNVYEMSEKIFCHFYMHPAKQQKLKNSINNLNKTWKENRSFNKILLHVSIL